MRDRRAQHLSYPHSPGTASCPVSVWGRSPIITVRISCTAAAATPAQSGPGLSHH